MGNTYIEKDVHVGVHEESFWKKLFWGRNQNLKKFMVKPSQKDLEGVIDCAQGVELEHWSTKEWIGESRKLHIDIPFW